MTTTAIFGKTCCASFNKANEIYPDRWDVARYDTFEYFTVYSEADAREVVRRVDEFEADKLKYGPTL